jgi:DNA-binding NarL/FixJ family response regulator
VGKPEDTKEIGVAVDISEATVKVYLTHILWSLNVAGRQRR